MKTIEALFISKLQPEGIHLNNCKKQFTFFEQKINHLIESLNIKRILYIDSCKLSCKIIKKLLIQKGYRDIRILNRVKHFGELLEIQPDLIMTEIIIPGYLSGYQIAKYIKEYSSSYLDVQKNIPIIATTVLNDNKNMRELCKYFDYYINKPLLQESLSFLPKFNPIKYAAKNISLLKMNMIEEETKNKNEYPVIITARKRKKY